MYHTFDADLLIKPAEGKVFIQPAYFEELANDERISACCPVIEENVFLQYRGMQSVAVLKAVDSVFYGRFATQGTNGTGEFNVYFGEVEEAVVGRNLANNLGINVAFIDPLWVYFPERDAVFSPLDPMASLKKRKTFPLRDLCGRTKLRFPVSVCSTGQARRLFDYPKEISYLEIRVHEGVNTRRLQREITAGAGPDFRVLNRYQQNETVYKMMTTRKDCIFLLLGFIVLIISCNVLGSLSMLILEKKDDVEILESMGAKEKQIRTIFITEGWLISVLGLLTGLFLGLLLCWLQTTFGLISLPGSFMVSFLPGGCSAYRSVNYFGYSARLGSSCCLRSGTFCF
jgi:ABC-type lipoprotein release transport system permease subunit